VETPSPENLKHIYRHIEITPHINKFFFKQSAKLILRYTIMSVSACTQVCIGIFGQQKNNDILSKHQFYNISNIVLLNTNC